MECVIAGIICVLALRGIWDVAEWLYDHLPRRWTWALIVALAALDVGLMIWG